MDAGSLHVVSVTVSPDFPLEAVRAEIWMDAALLATPTSGMLLPRGTLIWTLWLLGYS